MANDDNYRACSFVYRVNFTFSQPTGEYKGHMRTHEHFLLILCPTPDAREVVELLVLEYFGDWDKAAEAYFTVEKIESIGQATGIVGRMRPYKEAKS